MTNEPKVIKNRYEFILYPDERSNADGVELTFEVPEDLHCAAFHRMCKKFGLVLGYAEASIEKYFGEDSYEDL